MQTAPRAVSVSVTVPLPGGHLSVNDLEAAVLEATRAAGRQLYLKAFAAAQEAWLAQHPNRFSAQRWCTLHWLTPFGPILLPVRVVRDKASGRYLTLSKVFLRHKATRLLSPALEQEACAAATEQNYRPAAKPTPRPPWKPWPKAPCASSDPRSSRRSGATSTTTATVLTPGTKSPPPFAAVAAAPRPPSKSGSGAVEKNIEVHINRRFKRQGRSWHPLRAERLLALGQLLAQPQAWTQGWKSKPQFHIQPNPP